MLDHRMLRRSPCIPEPLAVPYLQHLRKRSSAAITRRALPDHLLELIVVHAPLVGITRPMLEWWMQHIDQQVDWGGHHILAYRLWHPRDHIHFQIHPRPDGTIGSGCRFRIVEAFQANPRHRIDRTFTVTKLDATGFRLELRICGVVIVTLDEAWIDVPDGVQWTVTHRIGTNHPLLGPLTRLVRWMRRDLIDAWLTHNVEEAGCIPEFLPELYQRSASGSPR